MNRLKIATRNSPLALWQAGFVKNELINIYPELEVKLVGMQTQGDRLLDAPLATVGGKGLFIKQLEQALIDHRADIAVHSMKDVTIELPDNLILPVIMKREDPRDVLISNKYKSISELTADTVLGTSSLRRQSQIKSLNPGIQTKNLRGNIGTRLRRLDAGQYDAIILAAAGIKRLGMAQRIAEYIPPSILLPATGQGAIGIECRSDDPEVLDLIRPLTDRDTTLCVQTERAFSGRLYGGCRLPIAGQADIIGDELHIVGLVADPDGSEIIKAEHRSPVAKENNPGIALAEKLLERGADKILEKLLH